MRYVKQRHAGTCAVASIAMLSGTGYDKLYKSIKRHFKWKRVEGLDLEEELIILSKLKIQYKILFNKIDLNKIKNNALISFKYKYSFGRHAIVWDASKKKILDPSYKKGMIKYSKSYIENNMNYIIETIK